MNTAANTVLGDRSGAKVTDVFGSELAEAQAASFVTSITLNDALYVVKVMRSDDVQAFFLSRELSELEIISDPFLLLLRDNLSNIEIAGNLLRDRIEQLGDRSMLGALASSTRSYFRISRILQNISILRDFAAGNLTPALSTVDLAEHLKENIDTVQKLCPTVTFSLSVPDSLILHADLSMMDGILFNLLANCMIHAKGLSRISICLMDLGETVMLSVSDDGCGIPQEKLHTVFNRYRYNFTLNDMNRGIGLGLGAVQSAAKAHCGTVLLESRPDHGTTVRVSVSKGGAGASPRTPLPDYQRGIRSLLIGLADCLPPECFSERFLD